MQIETILSAAQKTTNTVQKKACLLNLPNLALKIQKELQTKQYSPKRFSCFAVRDPKVREIFAPHYSDRIIHHILIDQLEKEIDPRFIFDSFSNRKSKGCHKAVERLQSFVRNTDTEYFLQLDIKSFFTSINKKILFKIIKRQIKQSNFAFKKTNELIRLCQIIIFHNPTEPEPLFTGNRDLLKLVPLHKSLFACPKYIGLPIGSLTSQFFANVYLNELDQFVKHKLKVKYYLRYVDDFVLLSKSSEELMQWKKEIDLFLQIKLKLYIHPKKTKLQHKSKGIDFLGYIIKPEYLLIRRRVIKSFKRRLYFFNHLLNPIDFPIRNPPEILKLSQKLRNKELIPPVVPTLPLLQQMLATINAYYGIFKFAQSFRLRQNLYQKHFHELKKYFEPKNQTWESLRIRE